MSGYNPKARPNRTMCADNTGASNAMYAVDYETGLVAGSWTTLTNTTGTGRIMTVTDSGAALLTQRFYRVNLVVPP